MTLIAYDKKEHTIYADRAVTLSGASLDIIINNYMDKIIYVGKDMAITIAGTTISDRRIEKFTEFVRYKVAKIISKNYGIGKLIHDSNILDNEQDFESFKRTVCFIITKDRFAVMDRGVIVTDKAITVERVFRGSGSRVANFLNSDDRIKEASMEKIYEVASMMTPGVDDNMMKCEGSSLEPFDTEKILSDYDKKYKSKEDDDSSDDKLNKKSKKTKLIPIGA